MNLHPYSKIYVAGHTGMVGSAIMRRLKQEGFENIITQSSSQLDLRNQQEVENFFADAQPEFVFLAAAKVGGILANNTYRAEFIHDNLSIQNNIIHQSYIHNVKKLLFLGSSCIYPKLSPQPIKEEYLLTGELEATNEPYALAKIAGIKMCEAYRKQYGCNFISVMPTNLFGINDSYDSNNSHVLPALIKKFDYAKKHQQSFVEIWGTGKARREFLYSDDLADACLYLMKNYNEPTPVNIGTGEDISIKELAELIKNIVGFDGDIHFDTSMPDGTLRKLLDVSKLTALGWTYKTSFKKGLRLAYEDFQKKFQFAEAVLVQ